MSLIAANQITAITGVVLAAGAIVTGVFAYLAFRKQSQEVGILQQQLQNEISKRHRDQATRVFAWVDRVRLPKKPAAATAKIALGAEDPLRHYAIVTNASDRPVYNLAVFIHSKLTNPESSHINQDTDALLPGNKIRCPHGGVGIPLRKWHRRRWPFLSGRASLAWPELRKKRIIRPIQMAIPFSLRALGHRQGCRC